MDTFDTVVQRILKNPAAWNRVQRELLAADDREARFIELAQEYGMNIDVKELRRAVGTAELELSDDELVMVSGGFNPQPEPPALDSTQQQRILIGMLLPAVQKV